MSYPKFTLINDKVMYGISSQILQERVLKISVKSGQKPRIENLPR